MHARTLPVTLSMLIWSASQATGLLITASFLSSGHSSFSASSLLEYAIRALFFWILLLASCSRIPTTDTSSTPCSLCGLPRYAETYVLGSKPSIKATSASASDTSDGTPHPSLSRTTLMLLHSAYETALELPLEKFAPSPHLKLSGIAIALASTLEEAERPEPAYEVYSDALSRLRAANAASPLSGPERLRAVALASKLGEMAETYQLPVAEEERWLTYAVEELLRLIRDETAKGQIAVEGDSAAWTRKDETPLMLAELEMPPWVTKTDVGAPLEALGRFYAREGNVECVCGSSWWWLQLNWALQVCGAFILAGHQSAGAALVEQKGYV